MRRGWAVEKNTLPPGIGALEVFETFVRTISLTFPACSEETTDFGELASEGNVRASENAAALSAVHSRNARARLRMPTHRRRPKSR